MNIFKRRLKKEYELAMEGWHSQIAENEKLKSTINHLNEQIAELKEQLATLGDAYSNTSNKLNDIFNRYNEELRKNSENDKETTRKFIEKKSGRRSRRIR